MKENGENINDSQEELIEIYKNNYNSSMLIFGFVALLFIFLIDINKNYNQIFIYRNTVLIVFAVFILFMSFLCGIIGILERIYSKIPAIIFSNDGITYRDQAGKKQKKIFYRNIAGVRKDSVLVKSATVHFIELYIIGGEKITIFTGDLSCDVDFVSEEIKRRIG